MKPLALARLPRRRPSGDGKQGVPKAAGIVAGRSAKHGMSWLRGWIQVPGLAEIRRYQPSWLGGDLLAGLTARSG